jgi:predicted  nucleic acid-binding Zn-ribbon protein
MGFTDPLRHSYPNMQTPELDPKDERLQELSMKIGYLEGRNSVLEIDCQELREKNRRLNEQLAVQMEDSKKSRLDRDDYQERAYAAERERNRLAVIVENWKEKQPEDKPDEPQT